MRGDKLPPRSIYYDYDADSAFMSPRPAPMPGRPRRRVRVPVADSSSQCPSISEPSSSPALSMEMPLTPTSSDCGFRLPSSKANPLLPALPPVILDVDADHGLEIFQDEDSDWYHEEFSDLIETPHLSPTFQPSRPDSLLITTDFDRLFIDSKQSSSDYPRRGSTKPPCRKSTAPSLAGTVRPPPRSSLPTDVYFESIAEPSSDSDLVTPSMCKIDFSYRANSSPLTPVSCRPLPSHPVHQYRPLPPLPVTARSIINMGQEVEIHTDDFQLIDRFKLTLPILSTSFDDFLIQTSLGEHKNVVDNDINDPKRLPEPPKSAFKEISSPVERNPRSPPPRYHPSPPVSHFDDPYNPPSFHTDESIPGLTCYEPTLSYSQIRWKRNNIEDKGDLGAPKFGGTSPTKISKRRLPSPKYDDLTTPTSTTFGADSHSPQSFAQKSNPFTSFLSSSTSRWSPSRAYKSLIQPRQRSKSMHQPNKGDIVTIGYGDRSVLKRRGTAPKA